MSSHLSAVVVAAGRSERFLRELSTGGSTQRRAPSKLFVEWHGHPLIRHSLEALSALPLEQIALVIRAGDEVVFEEALSGFKHRERIIFVEGGTRRQDSVRNGLLALTKQERVLIHDGARPFLDPNFLNRLYEMSLRMDAVIPGLKVVETLKEVDEAGRVRATVDRSRFVRVQTPQFFDFKKLLAAHEKFSTSDKEFTDDAALMEFCGHDVVVLEGRDENIKVTVPEDLRRVGIHV